MSILIKGIDLPKDDNYIVLEIEKNGTVEAYSSTLGVVDGDPIAIQIDRPHGRLIDAEALELEKEVELADDWKTAHEIANCVKYAPTIIEAEE